jgi:hypothetical protein
MVEVTTPAASQQSLTDWLKAPAGPQAPQADAEPWGEGNHKSEAMKNLNLSPQEQNLYDHHLENLRKGGVKNPNGSTSTIRNITSEVDGKHYVIPTVWNNQIVSPDQAMQNAKKAGLDKFPSYDTELEAEQRYLEMHDYMEKDIK